MDDSRNLEGMFLHNSVLPMSECPMRSTSSINSVWSMEGLDEDDDDDDDDESVMTSRANKAPKLAGSKEQGCPRARAFVDEFDAAN